MGLRFRKSIKLAPGVKLNLGKKSAGVSVGGKYGGVSYNTKTGTRARVSAPGTGLSYTTKIDGSDKSKSTKSNSNSNDGNGSCLLGLLAIFGILVGLILVAQFFWVVGIIFLIFFRKKFNDDPKTQKIITVIVGILSALSFLFMIGSMNDSSDNPTPTTTESQTDTETEETSEYESTTEHMTETEFETEFNTESTSEVITTPADNTVSGDDTHVNTESDSQEEPVQAPVVTPTPSIPEENITSEPTPETTPEVEQVPETPVTPPANEPVMVWVDDTAARYHSKNGCGMDNAYQVTLEEAIAMGKTPCGRCYK